MYDLETNKLLEVCISEYLQTNPTIELKGFLNSPIPDFLKNKNYSFVENYSKNSLKIRCDDWAIIPYDIHSNKYIIGWIKNNDIIANNIPIAIAIWFNLPPLGCSDSCNICHNYLKAENQELDPLIYMEN